MKTSTFIFTVVFIMVLSGSPMAKMSFVPMKLLAAKVDGIEIGMQRYERAVSKARRDLAKRTSDISLEGSGAKMGHQDIDDREMKASILNELIDHVLIGNGARREGIKVKDPQVTHEINLLKGKFPSSKEFHRSIAEQGMTLQDLKDNIAEQLRAKALERMLMAKMVVPDEEITVFYNKNIDLFVQPKKVSLQQIVIGDKDLAEGLIASLEAGSDFNEMAMAYSKDLGTRDSGGEMGFLERGALPPELEEWAFKLPPGKISGPIELEDGFHILRVISRVPGKDISLLQAKDNIRQFLLEGKSVDAFSKWLEDQRSASDIVINEKLRYLFGGEQIKGIMKKRYGSNLS